jgi:hypothetical protein
MIIEWLLRIAISLRWFGRIIMNDDFLVPDRIKRVVWIGLCRCTGHLQDFDGGILSQCLRIYIG